MKKLTRKEKRNIEAEVNPLKELFKVIKHFFKDFINELRNIDDPRHKSYITYESATILLTALLGHIMTVGTMKNLAKNLIMIIV